MNRRTFLRRTALAGTVGLGLTAWHQRHVLAEPPPETTRIRLSRYSVDIACVAPQWVAEELLREEGFTRVEYTLATALEMLAAGRQDILLVDAPGAILALDEGTPIVVVAGIHGGCFELAGTDRVRSVLDLRGRRVAVANSGRHAFVAAMASYVGLDPRKDITFVLAPEGEAALHRG